ncbi:MAG: hypothetical protein LBQ51_01865, partial [Desulfovibrio sp.]|nr:hypothetical protein [Desulfovibrio sp.]
SRDIFEGIARKARAGSLRQHQNRHYLAATKSAKNSGQYRPVRPERSEGGQNLVVISPGGFGTEPRLKKEINRPARVCLQTRAARLEQVGFARRKRQSQA